MKTPRYKKMPRSLRHYWKQQDFSVQKIGFAYGLIVGATIIGLVWLMSI